jgi:hypothetical protein
MSLLPESLSWAWSFNTYRWISSEKIIISKPNIFTETRTQDSFWVCDLSSCNLAWTKKFCLGAILLLVLSFRATETVFIGTGTQESFRVCDLSSCNLLFETNKFGPGTVLLSCLDSEQQKQSSSEIELRTVFWGSGLCFCNIIFETNKSDLGAVLLLCLVPELQETPSPRNELRTFSGVLTLLCSLPGLKE